MPSKNVSILNECLGPVMRGPSSSHTAAAVRIGTLCKGIGDGGGGLVGVEVVYDPEGSLAEVAGTQGNDLGLCGGLMGWDCCHERLKEAEEAIKETGIDFTVKKSTISESNHPNTHKITVFCKDGSSHSIVALSVGGGAIRVPSIDGVPLNSTGTLCYSLIYTSDPDPILSYLTSFVVEKNWVSVTLLTRPHENHPQTRVISVESLSNITLPSLDGFKYDFKCELPMVMPVGTPVEISLPFTTTDELQKFAESTVANSIWEMALEYEHRRSGLEKNVIFEEICRLIDIYKTAVSTGLQGTEYADRILGPQAREYKSFLDLGVVDVAVKYAAAVMEVKSSFGVIIGAPTAGSCGVIPGCLLAVGEALGSTREELGKALLACGLVGVLIATRSTFAAEEGGCQAECGAAGAMAAAGVVYLKGGTAKQSITAASMTLQSVLGMVCDPIASRVEAPCLLRNINTAVMALTSTNLALSAFSPVIPFDEVLASHWEISQSLSPALRCTGRGGLAAQPSSKRLQEKLLSKCGGCGCSKNATAIPGTVYPETW